MLKLRELLERLHAADVEFVIVGGVAARVNGSTLPTEDLDVCCDMSEKNMTRFVAAIAPIHPVVRGDPRKLKVPLNPSLLARVNTLIMTTSLGDFDLLSEVEPIGRYDAVLKESFVADVEGKPTRVLNIDALIAAKRKAGRPKDKLGVLHLESAKKRREQTGQSP
ncbi:MAG: hypothetical protein WBD40_15005 [Tepidisphaeraceae bacterium]